MVADLDKRSLSPDGFGADHGYMRRGQTLLLAFVVLLLAVPVAGADDKHKDSLRAVGVSADHATLQAWAQPLSGGATSVSFEYGTSTEYGTTVAAAPKTLPGKGGTASASVHGLEPDTTYHFRAVLTVGPLRVAGPDATFKTPAAPGPKPPAAEPTPGAPDPSGDDKSSDAPPPAPVHAPEAPVLGRTVAVGPRAGDVAVLKPHGRRFVPLTAGDTVPSGSVVDATDGTVALTSALDAHGRTQTGEFTGGRFLVRQSKHGRGMIDLYLRGSLASCRAGTASIARKHKRGRALWGHDHGGRFRTHGATSVATVRGTRWLTKDTCAGTVTRVTRGVVAVRDQVRHRTVVVRAGHSYLARHRR